MYFNIFYNLVHAQSTCRSSSNHSHRPKIYNQFHNAMDNQNHNSRILPRNVKNILIMHKRRDTPILSKRAFWNEVKCHYPLGYFLFLVATKRRWVIKGSSQLQYLISKGRNKWHQPARLRHRGHIMWSRNAVFSGCVFSIL